MLLLPVLLSSITLSTACLSSGVGSSCGCSSCPCSSKSASVSSYPTAPYYAPALPAPPPPSPPQSSYYEVAGPSYSGQAAGPSFPGQGYVPSPSFQTDSASYGYQQNSILPSGYSVISPASSYNPYGSSSSQLIRGGPYMGEGSETANYEIPNKAPPAPPPPAPSSSAYNPPEIATETLSETTVTEYPDPPVTTVPEYTEPLSVSAEILVETTTEQARQTFAPSAQPTMENYGIPESASGVTVPGLLTPMKGYQIPPSSAEYSNQIQVPSSQLTSESDEYLSVLKPTSNNQRTSFVTYYNQECGGAVMGRSREMTLSAAAQKCAMLGCRAANAKPDEHGTYQVDFLRSVKERVNQSGCYCMSLNTVPLKSLRKARANAVQIKVKNSGQTTFAAAFKKM